MPDPEPLLDLSVDLTVVMPAHNEVDLLVSSVEAVLAGLRERPRSFEVVVVENGSSDGTEAVADDLARRHLEVRSLHHQEPDYGRSLRAGFLAARGAVVVNFDVDYTDLAFLDRAVSLIETTDAVVVVGSKRGEGADDTRSLPRRLVTLVFSTVLRKGFGLQVSDTHGMKALEREPLVALVERCVFGRDLFDTELVLRAERAGLTTREEPVVVRELRPSRTSIARRIPRTVAGLVRLRRVLADERRAGSHIG